MERTASTCRISLFRSRTLVWFVLAALLWSFVPSVSRSQQPTATISALSGAVLVNGQEAGEGIVMSAGDIIESQAGASVVLELSDGSLLELGENTKLNIAELSQTATGARVSHVKMMWGWLRAKLSPGHQQAGAAFHIETPNALVGVKFSQPDVKVSYDPTKKETVALALTVALAVKNLLTDEEKIVPIGSIAIITALGIKVIGGAAAAGIIAAETTGSGATGTGTTAATTTGTSSAGGVSTGTWIALGVGAAAAAGGIVALTAGSEDSNRDSNDDRIHIGIFRREFSQQSQNHTEFWKQTIEISRKGNAVDGMLITEVSFNNSCSCFTPAFEVPVTGTIEGASLVLNWPSGEGYCECCCDEKGLPTEVFQPEVPGGTYNATLEEGGMVLRIQGLSDFRSL
jgi:hypothetical protein